MDRNKNKGNAPEMLVDYNGNAVQAAWMLGGKTLTITDGSTFVAESTLMRICNSGSTVVRVKLSNADYTKVPSRNPGADVGVPILPNTAIMVGVHNKGQIYEVSGGSLDITFVYDRNTPTLA